MKQFAIESYPADINVLHIFGTKHSTEGMFPVRAVTTTTYARSDSLLIPSDSITTRDDGSFDTHEAYGLGCPHCTRIRLALTAHAWSRGKIQLR